MASRFDKATFINIVATQIERCGRAYFIYGSHVATALNPPCYTIALRDYQAALDSAIDEGFRCSDSVNGYGVHSLVITL